MSTDSGDKAAMAGPIAQSKALIDAGREAVAVQDELFDTISAEDMVEAREALEARGVPFSRREQVLEARQRRRGRPKNARNKRTEDFARYILSHGQDPAVTLIEIASTQPELLIEASAQPRVHSFRADGTANVVTERMTYEQAQALRARCADILMPYIHGKKPIAIDMNFAGVADLIIEGVTHTREEIANIVDADFMPVDDDDQDPAK
ncbi:MAG: hypothetical protein ACOY5R_06620 [Pseudomonadota bacterium]